MRIGQMTLEQAVRNAVVSMGALPEVHEGDLIRRIKANAQCSTADVVGALRRMQDAHEITLTPEGVWVLGHHVVRSRQLTLTSPDPEFGQPRLWPRQERLL